ncbi:MAG: proteasome assembly chaperone family protein [Candidatus Woesearchaeota archaeon]
MATKKKPSTKTTRKTTKTQSKKSQSQKTNKSPGDIGGVLSLKKKPKNATIIEGFPGFGLIGTICTEYLINHLQTEQIGSFWFEDMPAAVAIHGGKLVPPIEFHYNKKYNVVILHALSAPSGTEWKISDLVMKVADELKAKEILSMEGVGSQEAMNPQMGIKMGDGDGKTFYYTTNSKQEAKLKLVAEPIKESIILGVTGALLLKEKETPMSALFVETSSSLPDSKAAAQMITMLDKYLGLKVDPKPLLKTAEQFEDKIKKILGGHKQATEMKQQRQLDYLG